MGIHYWSKSAVLGLAIAVSLPAFSATQVKTPTVPFQSIMNAAQGAVNLPYGDPAFFGAEYVSEHTAGNRFGSGASTGQAGSLPKVKVAIKPVITINPAKVAAAARAAIKGGNVPGVVASAAVAWAIDQIPGASVTPEGTLLRTPQGLIPTSGTSFDYYMTPELPGVRYDTPKNLCIAAAEAKGNIPDGQGGGLSGGTCYYKKPDEPWTSWSGAKYTRYVQQCPSMLRTAAMYCSTGAPEPFTETDYDALQDAIENVTNSDWLRDLTKAKCAGSLSPEACYQDLVQRRPNHGPSSQTTPPVSTTTTTTNPDGTTSTTQTTTQHKYDYTYTENNYTYKVTTTTTTTKNGQTTTETTEDTSPPDAPPYVEPSENEQDQESPEFQDSEFPAVTPFYEQKYPDGLSGVWSQVSADIDNSAFIGFLKSFVPTFSGSCPTFGLSFNIASWANFGAVSFWNMCWIFDFIKIIFLVTAVFTARALTFGG